MFLRPPGPNGTEKFRFIEVPVIKSDLDPSYFKCLRIIREKDGSIATEELVSRLKSKGENIDNLKLTLLKMRGHGVISAEKDGQFTNLTEMGNKLLSLYEDSRFREYVSLVGRRL